MLPILINYMAIHHTLTYWGIILSMITPIHITCSPTYPSVETGDMHHYWQWQWQYCWGRLLLCSSSCRQICGTPHFVIKLRELAKISPGYHRATGGFATDLMVSCVHRKCQTRAGVSGDVKKTLECVTITDSKFSNRVLVWMTPKSTTINWVTIWLDQLDFCLNRCKCELPDQHIANCYVGVGVVAVGINYPWSSWWIIGVGLNYNNNIPWLFSLHQGGVVMSSQVKHTHSHQDVPFSPYT